MYVYILTERPCADNNYHTLWTVGHYDPTSGDFISESDHSDKDKAAERVAWLNGSK